MLLPAYAPLRFRYDKTALLAEYEDKVERYLEHSLVAWPDHQYRPVGGMMIGSLEDNLNVTHAIHHPDGTRSEILGIPSWEKINIRHVPHDPYTIERHMRQKAMVFESLNAHYHHEWTPREEFDLPILDETIARLPFEWIQQVRFIALPPGGFGPVHRDELPESYRLGIGNINLQLATGGSPLRMKINREEFDIWDEAFTLKICFPHGVPKVKTKRITLCICGQIDQKAFDRMVDYERARWAPEGSTV